eukprot:8401-Lingulodinium_polyedra.AAC.1
MLLGPQKGNPGTPARKCASPRPLAGQGGPEMGSRQRNGTARQLGPTRRRTTRPCRARGQRL